MDQSYSTVSKEEARFITTGTFTSELTGFSESAAGHYGIARTRIERASKFVGPVRVADAKRCVD